MRRLIPVLALVLLLVHHSQGADRGCCRKVQRKLEKEIQKRCRMACPVGFTQFDGFCYWLVMGHSDIKNWWEAKDFCQRHGANLATLNKHVKAKFVRNYLKANFGWLEHPIKLYTGLVYTDKDANDPYDPHITTLSAHVRSADHGNSLRWTGNKEWVPVNWTSYEPVGKKAKWSPAIGGTPHSGPGLMSCVVLLWEPNHSSLTWLYNDCKNKHLNLICEVKLPEIPKRQSRQTRRRKRTLFKHTSDETRGSELYKNTSIEASSQLSHGSYDGEDDD